ncbi:MAG: 30S ribosomal protein S12 methylthiotransferase RimO, partial [Gammaproteobacteria bacterium]|nr:30S ribosomal protein S12 methylthiotransferase RimO [Gammaproteobacteria bacterium]
AYSPVEGAAANELGEPVPEEVKQERLARFMEKQIEISAERLKRNIGKEIQVLIDEVGESGAIARSMADAPDIDGLVYILEAHDLQPGDRVWVHIDNTDEHDMWATLVD